MLKTEHLLSALLLLASTGPLHAATPTALPGIPSPPAASAAASASVSWPSLAAAQKRDLRSRYAAWQALPDSEKQRLRQAASALAAMPPTQRDALHARFAGMDKLHRDGWLLGAQLGTFYPRLQPLFGFVPDAERVAVIALLRGLDATQLEQLSLVSMRTPPQERDALRAQLLGLAPAQRDAWLREKVGH